MRLGYFSPLPPQQTGVAKYSANLLPALAQLARLTVYEPQPSDLPQVGWRRRPLPGFAGPLQAGLDICLYQMGNHIGFHEQIYRLLRRYPSVVTLHDLNLHSFYGELYLKREAWPAYVREMAFAHGPAGARQARRALLGQAAYDVRRYPLFERCGRGSLGVLTHSRYAAAAVGERCPATPVKAIHLPVAPLKLPERAAARRELGLAEDDLLLLSLGFISWSKRPESVLRALAQLRPRFPGLKYALVGADVWWIDLRPLIAELGLQDCVRLSGWADERLYAAYLAAADIGLNLRYPTHGETSATLFELLAAGVPTLVSNVDAFVELPDAAVVKIDAGPGEADQVAAVLAALAAAPEQRLALGRQAAAHVRDHCQPEAVAADIVAFLEAILEGLPEGRPRA
ncbi:MAG: glycosyltransferase family 4 protein [Candidatus Promineifilaceae bacterium]